MGKSIRLSGVTFTNFVSREIPYSANMLGAYLPGVSEAETIINRADRSAPGTIIGSPVYASNYATFDMDTSGIDTGIASGGDFTHVIVCTEGPNAQASYMGAWDGGSTQNLIFKGTGQLATAVNGQDRVVIAYPTHGSNYLFLAGSHNGTDAIVAYHNGASLQSNSAAYSAAITPTPDILIGGNTFGAGLFNCAFAATFDIGMTTAQMTEVYDAVKDILAARGITVV